MRTLSDSKAIFQQLAATPGSMGVQTIIENHDAWLNNSSIMREVSAAMRAQITAAPRHVAISQRIQEQRTRLQSLVTRLPIRIASAG